jgi:hypothetical protein
MNCLYLSLINIEKATSFGVNKKINGQIKAMKRHGLNMYKIVVKNSGLYAFYEGKEFFLKKSFLSKKYDFIDKRIIYYKSILNFIKRYNIEAIYIRYQLSDPFFINFIKKCKNMGLKIFLEIPSYPYEKEIIGLTKYVDRFFRRFLYKYVDKVITYSDHKTIFGIPTIKISNGIDLEIIKVKEYNNDSDVINLVGVASISKWHGFDRIIEGLSIYYSNNTNIKEIFFHIVGEGHELDNLKKLTKKLNLEKYVIFHGFKSGKELDEIFDKCDIAIGSLGMHRMGLKSGSTLKIREYCARGIPFVIGYRDDDFSYDFKYKYTVVGDDSSINILEIINFYNSIKNDDYIKEMRKYAKEKISWDAKMKPVISRIVEGKNENIKSNRCKTTIYKRSSNT